MTRVLLALLALALTACDAFPTNCVARGTTSTFSGSVTYSGQVGTAPGMPLTGALPMTVSVDDATPGCTYDGMEFTIDVGPCSLWATLSSGDDAGVALSAPVEPDQTCTLPLASGDVTMSITSGLFVEGSATSLTLSGSITRGDGGSSDGYLEWSFVSP